tara:strand:+ start:930 stop:1334 length:405 start_codon:yes stop_codon:yes gene_type:complete
MVVSGSLMTPVYGQIPNSYPSKDMEADRREVMYMSVCVDSIKRFRAKKFKDFDPTVTNNLLRDVMTLYTEILAQEYPNGKYSEEFIKKIMRDDQQGAQNKLDSNRGDCFEFVVGGDFSKRYVDLLNKYAKTAKP